MSTIGCVTSIETGTEITRIETMSFELAKPLIIDQDSATVTEKQGIVSILGSDGDRAKAASIRRTLSADMSSKKWLAQNVFPSIKKVASSEHLINFSSSSKGEDEKEWMKSPSQSQSQSQNQNQSQVDVWLNILSQKADEDKSKLPPPYVHPLVKRASSLSEKSLQVCTESLGSETGSDGFSSYSSSESGDEEKDENQILLIPQQQDVISYDNEETYNYTTTSKKVLQPRSFPPPLPSLSRADGPSLHMHSHRENGRLLLEAVSVPSNNFFHAQRQDGRLLLTLLNTNSENKEAHVDQVEEKLGEYEDVFGVFDEEESKIEEDEDEIVGEIEKFEKGIQGKEMVKGTRIMSRVINVHRSAFSMKKLMGFENLNPSWSQKFNKGVKLVEVEDDPEMVIVENKQKQTQFAQSLPPLAPRAPTSGTTAAASFNAYEYFWRAKSTSSQLIKPTNPQNQTNNKLILSNNYPKVCEQQEMVLLRANKSLVPSLRGCKEPRRTLLLWEPYCIATS